MILIVTNKQDYTADFLILKLQNEGVPYVRFNTEDFSNGINIFWEISNKIGIDGYITFNRERISLKDITSTWYRRPINPNPSKEITNSGSRNFSVQESLAVLRGLWNTLNCFWVSDPYSINRAENKPYQLQIARSIGFKIPNTIITNVKSEVEEFFSKTKSEIITKPISQGTVRRNGKYSLVYTNVVKSDRVDQDLIENTPTLFQHYSNKESDIRATVIGKKVFCVKIKSTDKIKTKYDWRRSQDKDLIYENHQLPGTIENQCIKIVQMLGLAFGAIDMILGPNGEYSFLEINPNGQWAWIEQQTGLSMSKELLKILEECHV